MLELKFVICGTKIVVQFFLRIPSPALLCIVRVFEQFKTKKLKLLELFNGRFLFALLSSSEVMLYYTD